MAPQTEPSPCVARRVSTLETAEELAVSCVQAHTEPPSSVGTGGLLSTKIQVQGQNLGTKRRGPCLAVNRESLASESEIRQYGEGERKVAKKGACSEVQKQADQQFLGTAQGRMGRLEVKGGLADSSHDTGLAMARACRV